MIITTATILIVAKGTSYGFPAFQSEPSGAHSGREADDLVANLFRQHGWRVKQEPRPADKGGTSLFARGNER